MKTMYIFRICISHCISLCLVLKQEQKQQEADELTVSESTQSSPTRSVDSSNSSESDNNNTSSQETSNTSQQRRNIVTLPKTPMHEILKIIESGNITALLENKCLHYFFLKHCVINVISRKKWKENNTRYLFNCYIHASDKGFALIVLENNIIRYREMRDREKNESNGSNNNEDEAEFEYSQPLYTTVTKKGKRTTGKGWSDDGKTKFKEFTMLIQRKRRNKQWLTNRGNYIKKKALYDSKNSKKRKRSSENDSQGSKRMNSAEEEAWNKFLVDSVNDTEWCNNAVGV